MPSIKDLVEFVKEHKRGKAFFNYDDEACIHAIVQSLQQNALSFAVDEHDNIIGLAIGSVLPENKIFYVTNILTHSDSSKTKGVLACLLEKFTMLFPEFQLEARRHGKITRYHDKKYFTTERLISKVNNLTVKGII